MKRKPGQRPLNARIVEAALVLLLALPSLAGPTGASAAPPYIQATSPNDGDVLAAASPITVNWTTGAAGAVGVYVRTGSQQSWIASVPPGPGQYTFTLPDTFVCDPLATYRIRVTQTAYGGGTYTESDSGAFTLICPTTVSVTKQVVNTTSRRAPGPFRMRVQCEPGSQTFADVSAPGPGSYTRKVHVPQGSTTCTVQEVGMPLPPAGCRWLTTYPGGQQRQPGGPPVTVVNTLQCGPITPPAGR